MSKIHELILEELQRDREKFPQPTNSPHEGYAVLLEEVEEMGDEFNELNDRMKSLWSRVKNDNYSGQVQHLNAMHESLEKLIKEAVQVGAMIQKYKEDILPEFYGLRN